MDKQLNNILCKKCGKQIKPDSTFCPYCGEKQIGLKKSSDKGRLKHRIFIIAGITIVCILGVILCSDPQNHKSSQGDSGDMEICSECNGEGIITQTCFECDGEGIIIQTCSECDGVCYTDCSECYGSGRTRCTWCLGEGDNDCITCRGTGRIECGMWSVFPVCDAPVMMTIIVFHAAELAIHSVLCVLAMVRLNVRLVLGVVTKIVQNVMELAE